MPSPNFQVEEIKDGEKQGWFRVTITVPPELAKSIMDALTNILQISTIAGSVQSLFSRKPMPKSTPPPSGG